MVETQALSVSHSKFSFPTSVLPRPPSVSASPSLIPRLDLQVQTSTMKFLHELFLRDRRPSFNMADPGPGSVRANLADQTEAKSHAFVRVNSIHCLSLSLSLPLLQQHVVPLQRAIYISLSLLPRSIPPPSLPLSTTLASSSSSLFLSSPSDLHPSTLFSSAPPTRETVPIDELATTVL